MPSTHRFTNKTAIVTGGTTGIGFATAQALIEEGARVIITGQNEERLATAAKKLGPNAIAVRTDVRKVEDLDALARRAREVFDRVDILFANAGVGAFAPLEHQDEAAFDSQFDTNVKGLFFTVQKLLGLLGPGSSVILNASAVHTKGFAGASIYNATKAAVRSFARSLAAELGARGIRVNTVSPGLVPTDFQGKMGLPPEALQGFYAQVKSSAPLGRAGQVEEVARAVLFLASAESSYTTAADLPVDGGFMNV
jgi:NAD(P)-dependent dehydrogenase (short-subunit alcohol dehydrogenase family)